MEQRRWFSFCVTLLSLASGMLVAVGFLDHTVLVLRVLKNVVLVALVRWAVVGVC